MKNPIKSASEERENIERKIDSTVNTDGVNPQQNDGKSKTNDESGDTDPNDVADKPSFSDDKDDRNSQESGKFDGTIGI